MEQADMNKGCGDQAVPLAMKDQPGARGAEMNEVAGSRLAGRDTAKDHPEIDGAVNAEQKIGSGGDEDVPPAFAGVRTRHLAFIIRYGMRCGRAAV